MFQLLALGMSTLTFAHSHTPQHTFKYLSHLFILMMKGMIQSDKGEQKYLLTRRGVIAQGDQWAPMTIGESLKALVWRLRRGNSY